MESPPPVNELLATLSSDTAPLKHQRLASSWMEKKIVLLFLRHLGCRFCLHLADAFNRLHAKLEEHNVSLVAVSLGTVVEGRRWLAHTGFKGTLMLDESSSRLLSDMSGPHALLSKVYAAFQLTRQHEILSDPRVQAAAAGVAAQGFSDWDTGLPAGEFPGDVKQLGGVFVMGPGNQCEYAFRSEFAGHAPDLNQVMGAAIGVLPDGEAYMYPSSKIWSKELDVTHRSGTRRQRANSGFFLTDRDGASPIAPPNPTPAAPTPAPAPTPTPGSASAPAPAPAPTSSSAPAPSLAAATPPATCPVPSMIGMGPWGAMAVLGGVVLVLFWGATAALSWPVAVSVAAVLASLGWFTMQWDVPSPSSASPTTASVDADTTITVYTPREIDATAVALGAVQCDCGSVVKEIPVVGVSAALGANPSPSPSASAGTGTGAGAGAGAGSALASSAPESDAAMQQRLPVYQRILCYLREFLAKPHDLVGRRGPVCPFIPVALKRHSVYVTVIHTADLAGASSPSLQELQQMLSDLIKRMLLVFEKLDPVSGRYSAYKALILVFPDIAHEDAPATIDVVQDTCKPEFVKRGYMLGEFHRMNDGAGLRNPEFFPLRTPYPALAIRHMVPTDIAFLLPAKYSNPTRVSFLSAFLQRFGTDSQFLKTNRKEIDMARAALETAQAAL